MYCISKTSQLYKDLDKLTNNNEPLNYYIASVINMYQTDGFITERRFQPDSGKIMYTIPKIIMEDSIAAWMQGVGRGFKKDLKTKEKFEQILKEHNHDDFIKVKEFDKVIIVQIESPNPGKYIFEQMEAEDLINEIEESLTASEIDNRLSEEMLSEQAFLEEQERSIVTSETKKQLPGTQLSLFGLDNNQSNVKPGVQELFESNPELANQVYSALGFSKQINSGVEEILIIDKNEIPKKDGESFSEMQKRVTQNINIRKRIKIADKNNIIQGKSYSYSEIKEIFNNDELFNNEIYKQLSNVLQSSNLVFRFGSLNQGKKTINAYYNSISNSINIDTLVLETPNIATSDFKRILLHEIIHAFTFINLNKDATLTSTQKTALSNLNSIIEELNKDRDFFGQYGLTNANELLAELANDKFVDKLKNKKFNDNQSFFDKIISEIVKLLGLKTTAYDIVKESFDNLVKNYKSTTQIAPQQKQQALQAYSQYLDTIFPDSKVKDIVYHGTKGEKFDEFKPSEKGEFGKGVYFGDYQTALENTDETDDFTLEPKTGFDKNKIISAIINTQNIYIRDLGGNGKRNEYVVEPEQIHILGSKQDIEGFKEFVNQTKKPELSELEIQEFKEKFPNFANLQPFEIQALKDNEDWLDIICKL
jgi:ribosomal protein S7